MCFSHDDLTFLDCCIYSDCGSPCPKPCLCCFACKPECADGAVLYAGDLGQNPGELKGQRDQSNMLGATIQPITGGKFKPVVQVMERGDDTSGKPTPQMFAAARGPCFFGGCAEFCCDAEFGISKAKDGMGIDEIHQLAFDYASIKKTRPKNFTQAMREAFTDSDLYDVVFKEQVSAQQKANVLAAMVSTMILIIVAIPSQRNYWLIPFCYESRFSWNSCFSNAIMTCATMMARISTLPSSIVSVMGVFALVHARQSREEVTITVAVTSKIHHGLFREVELVVSTVSESFEMVGIYK